MSIEAMGWALKTPIGGCAKLVLIGIANHASAELDEARPAVSTLARYAHCDPRTVQRHLRSLETDGWIVRTGWHAVGGRSDRAVAVWRLTGRQNVTPSPERGDTHVANGVTPMSPEPSIEPSYRENRGACAPKIGGKAVVPEAWLLTQGALAAFNEQAGRKLRLLTSAGEASDAAKRIYGRVRAYPDLSLEEHEDIIRRTLSSRWWGQGDPSIGVVYGPAVFEENITRKSTPRLVPFRRNQTDPAKVARLEDMRKRLNAGEALFGPAAPAQLNGGNGNGNGGAA